MAYDILTIKKSLWLKLIKELKKRGKGKRESGAFLLGVEGSQTVIEFVCYDDLDPNCLTGRIEFSASGFNKLWQYSLEKNFTVLADVHTHPYDWTNQSYYDKTNPMIATKGHIALIIPYFAKKVTTDLTGIGIFEYLGSFKWKKNLNKLLITK